MENIILPNFFNKGTPKKSLKINSKINDNEFINDLMICECGNTSFKVFITNIIDDARLYCDKCGK